MFLQCQLYKIYKNSENNYIIEIKIFFFSKQIMNLYYIFQYLAQKKILLLLSMYILYLYI